MFPLRGATPTAHPANKQRPQSSDFSCAVQPCAGELRKIAHTMPGPAARNEAHCLHASDCNGASVDQLLRYVGAVLLVGPWWRKLRPHHRCTRIDAGTVGPRAA